LKNSENPINLFLREMPVENGDSVTTTALLQKGNSILIWKFKPAELHRQTNLEKCMQRMQTDQNSSFENKT
jgi:hypothetical protein